MPCAVRTRIGTRSWNTGEETHLGFQLCYSWSPGTTGERLFIFSLKDFATARARLFAYAITKQSDGTLCVSWPSRIFFPRLFTEDIPLSRIESIEKQLNNLEACLCIISVQKDLEKRIKEAEKKMNNELL